MRNENSEIFGLSGSDRRRRRGERRGEEKKLKEVRLSDCCHDLLKDINSIIIYTLLLFGASSCLFSIHEDWIVDCHNSLITFHG